ncbi:hypothetical protein [Klebsiella aerogenes]|uniref:hypothetical protein n=1 Tax=Klebsiella aerogenes TaxID=548 RepID=UPI001F2478CA|nr:hypothetical protein [Klebsiella aerogenes]
MEFKDLPATAKEAAEHALRHYLQHEDGGTGEMAVKQAGFIRDAFVALYFGNGNKLEPKKASGKMTATVAVGIPEPAIEPKKAWSVHVLNEKDEIVWQWHAADDVDTSGDAWRNGNHEIMTAVHYSLHHALIQAEELPKEKGWNYPFSINPGSEKSFQKCGKQIALEGLHKSPFAHAQDHHQHCKNDNAASCD